MLQPCYCFIYRGIAYNILLSLAEQTVLFMLFFISGMYIRKTSWEQDLLEESGVATQVKREVAVGTQGFIQAILMSGRRHKKLNLLIEFSNSIFMKFYFKAHFKAHSH